MTAGSTVSIIRVIFMKLSYYLISPYTSNKDIAKQTDNKIKTNKTKDVNPSVGITQSQQEPGVMFTKQS